MRKKRSLPFVPILAEASDGEKICEIPGCTAPGQYRAPRSRDDLRSYFWFCLGHVREYNASWNYYAGMDEREIEKQIRADVTWWRPSWPLGARSPLYNRLSGDTPRLDYGAFAPDDWIAGPGRPHNGEDRKRPRPGSAQERALAVFDLDPPVTRETIKARYKDLVKRHHPDANGGDRDAEERLKVINEAYAALKDGVWV